MADPVIRVCGLFKAFRLGFWMRRVEAVRGISFEVERGDIFGFLGPNGAGKTTTIKVLTGLVAPTGGHAELLGRAVPDPKSRRKIGFLPESPYIYPYLSPTEFVEMCGRLSGMRGTVLRDRVRDVIRTVGMSHAADRPARRLSKGMLQRTGLAAALVSDPELLILDEPMSGLDPVGRKEVRELIFNERRAGRTIFFSSHILSDVETLCDRVAILQSGKVIVSGRLDELLRRDVARANVVVCDISDTAASTIGQRGVAMRRVAERWILDVEGRDQLQALLTELLAMRVTVLEVTQYQETLEDLFMRHNIGTDLPNEPLPTSLDKNPRATVSSRLT
ncbi:MAG TPA: ABC transporter ATP-binding protein [Polyangiaceae bacterium]